MSYFNPRSPHRERPYKTPWNSAPTDFNPRSPHRERRHGYSEELRHLQDFNPRSPHRERPDRWAVRCSEAEFQSTLPSQGATEIAQAIADGNLISIHAPLTGSDRSDKRDDLRRSRFQSTLPSQGATKQTHVTVDYVHDFNPRSPHRERQTGVACHV